MATTTKHWPEYLMEATGLGAFMVSAGTFGTLIHHPSSPIRAAIADPTLRRALMGVMMGLTAIAIIYSPWGRRSGAHINPSVTLAFWRLGKVRTRDAAFYMLAQFCGGTLGVIVVLLILGGLFSQPPVQYVATTPGYYGVTVAFVAEMIIAMGMMLMILFSTNSPRLTPYTGAFAGCLVALYITFEDPLSGMSMNPARSFASALPGGLWSSLWIYFTAPPLGMLLAVELHRLITGRGHQACAKLIHCPRHRCIFCGYGMEEKCGVTYPSPSRERGRGQGARTEAPLDAA